MSQSDEGQGLRIGAPILRSAGNLKAFKKDDYDLVRYGYMSSYAFLLLMVVPMSISSLGVSSIVTFWVTLAIMTGLAFSVYKTYCAFVKIFARFDDDED